MNIIAISNRENKYFKIRAIGSRRIGKPRVMQDPPEKIANLSSY
jgi:hypothetical protein